ncbi:MAG: hypothetical protein H0W89_00985 [Candidatus Levybacteria bacterium]|nr:hypothetical protein [Candidatus Levybacteria bacterium]
MDQQNQPQSGDTHVCMGTCQAVITDEQYKGGLTACGAESCDMKGHPLGKGHKDEATGKNVSEE